ncbi:hypothetical protein ACFV9C_01390 [Kribbella sp. NPDC059898]|uniref:hypothetical protein n=1 Tax=Kribbella sp. NPDC059898 TaxID=3346995 RepID=UPI00365B666D
MDYKAFQAEYRHLLISIESLTTTQLTTEANRLRTLATTLHPKSDRLRATRLIAPLDQAIAAERPNPRTTSDHT